MMSTIVNTGVGVKLPTFMLDQYVHTEFMELFPARSLTYLEFYSFDFYSANIEEEFQRLGIQSNSLPWQPTPEWFCAQPITP